ncbi:MAG: hypothetical protein US40_C0002G0112 [Candidatus Roizmanbacteria bacterium GW2011_GWC2_37_13]|uniref:Uncharacterized protein n=1 Tax=Candidatus Roizmanbacteria bacterium GW2011_GWC2_37_13 TaxID=1618486 RepID=A0A0G0G636_9BACT|nr:MAG: hypothetical protein US38_C0006G0112 [Candidatus Roizmanbacteria bacterium GW2011_GWC1_37_12]KKQ26578.1 MAG: hypothetical protein US40_C0002G0112 [Candidatus Roizmanbacteria bacterium GW2011_GWC2_37_13]
MAKEIKSKLHTGCWATSNPLKRNLLSEFSYRSTSNRRLISAVGNGEGKNPLIIYDRFADSPVVLSIAERKALAISPYVNYLFTHGIVMPIWVNDAVYSFKNGGPERTILNKAQTDEDVDKLLKFYQEVDGSLLYSTSASHLVMPDLGRPIVHSVFTKLRVGRFHSPGVDFVPDREHAAGFTTSEAIENFFLEPHPEMKFELISFDHNSYLPIKVENSTIPLRGTLQRNYETRISYGKDEGSTRRMQALALGIIPDEIAEQLIEVKRPKFHPFIL